ncbi:hypothetical protein PMG11_03306 [Penicillium brasilianum]|uniref:Uncharacterized protein n=1 Tax=Penicillium brasilianum TaxID=104259 RepID=A0A0F7V9T2_PENBI|nr:hypothetical protein PMG11_03306 [Penicillium brasilianum]
MAEGWMTTNKVDDVLTLITAAITMVLFLRKLWKWTGKWREVLLTWLQQIGGQQTGGQQGDVESQSSGPRQAIELSRVSPATPRTATEASQAPPSAPTEAQGERVAPANEPSEVSQTSPRHGGGKQRGE